MKYVIDRVFRNATEYLNKLCQECADETISKNLRKKDLSFLRQDLIDYYVSNYFDVNKPTENSFIICGKFEDNPASLEFYLIFVKNPKTEVYHCCIFTKKDAAESPNSELQDIIRNFHKDNNN